MTLPRRTSVTYALSVAMPDLLIVDDDSDVSEILAEALLDEGYAVRRARDGQEGLEEVQRILPDLVLLDVEMPVLDGPAMAHAMLIHDLGAERVPIVLLSGIADFDRVVARVGTPYFLPKPYRLAEVLALITRALKERCFPKHLPRPAPQAVAPQGTRR